MKEILEGMALVFLALCPFIMICSLFSDELATIIRAIRGDRDE